MSEATGTSLSSGRRRLLELRANARSIMAVLMLAAAMGATVRLETAGPDEQAAMEAMAAVLAAKGDGA